MPPCDRIVTLLLATLFNSMVTWIESLNKNPNPPPSCDTKLKHVTGSHILSSSKWQVLSSHNQVTSPLVTGARYLGFRITSPVHWLIWRNFQASEWSIGVSRDLRVSRDCLCVTWSLWRAVKWCDVLWSDECAKGWLVGTSPYLLEMNSISTIFQMSICGRKFSSDDSAVVCRKRHPLISLTNLHGSLRIGNFTRYRDVSL